MDPVPEAAQPTPSSPAPSLSSLSLSCFSFFSFLFVVPPFRRPLSVFQLVFLSLLFLSSFRRESFAVRSFAWVGSFVRSFAVMPAANSVVPRSRCIAPWPRSCQSRRKKRIAVSVALLPMLFLHTARTFHSVSRRREIVNEQSYRSYLLLRGLRRRSSTSSSGDLPNSGTTDNFG